PKDVMTAMFNFNGSVDEQKKKLLWEFEEMFCTKYNFIFEDDGTLEKRVLSLDKNDKHRQSAESVNNDAIQKYFEKLTENFLHPLQQCFDFILKNTKTLIVQEEHDKIFSPEKFLKYIQRHGVKTQIFKKGKEQYVMDYYKY